jgi:hypothetical protein
VIGFAELLGDGDANERFASALLEEEAMGVVDEI